MKNIGGDLDLVERDPQGLNAHLGVSSKLRYIFFLIFNNIYNYTIKCELK